MTEGGYAGNQRYLIVTTAALCVLGGIGVARVFQGIELAVERLGGSRAGRPGRRVRRPSLLGLVAVAPVSSDKVDNIDATLDELRYEASLCHTLDDGDRRRPAAVTGCCACGAVYSGPFQTQMVAYELGVHGLDVARSTGTPPPGVAFRTHTIPKGPLVIEMTDARFRQVAADGRWPVSPRRAPTPPDATARRGGPERPARRARRPHPRSGVVALTRLLAMATVAARARASFRASLRTPGVRHRAGGDRAVRRRCCC